MELELELLELWFQEPTRLAPPCRVSHRRTAVPLVARFTNRGDLRDQTSGHPGGRQSSPPSWSGLALNQRVDDRQSLQSQKLKVRLRLDQSTAGWAAAR